jgi:hypothetical protein
LPRLLRARPSRQLGGQFQQFLFSLITDVRRKIDIGNLSRLIGRN